MDGVSDELCAGWQKAKDDRLQAELMALRAVVRAAQDVYDNRVPAGMKVYDFLWRALGDALEAVPKETSGSK
mgnify:CR=1 FL=1